MFSYIFQKPHVGNRYRIILYNTACSDAVMVKTTKMPHTKYIPMQSAPNAIT